MALSQKPDSPSVDGLLFALEAIRRRSPKGFAHLVRFLTESGYCRLTLKKEAGVVCFSEFTETGIDQKEKASH